MTEGFFTPIQLMQPIQGIGTLHKPERTAQPNSSFADIFSNAYNDAEEKMKNLEHQQYLLATGQIDDAHTVPIAASQAQLATDLLVQLRNKAIESYNELIRIAV